LEQPRSCTPLCGRCWTHWIKDQKTGLVAKHGCDSNLL